MNYPGLKCVVIIVALIIIFAALLSPVEYFISYYSDYARTPDFILTRYVDNTMLYPDIDARTQVLAELQIFPDMSFKIYNDYQVSEGLLTPELIRDLQILTDFVNKNNGRSFCQKIDGTLGINMDTGPGITRFYKYRAWASGNQVELGICARGFERFIHLFPE